MFLTSLGAEPSVLLHGMCYRLLLFRGGCGSRVSVPGLSKHGILTAVPQVGKDSCDHHPHCVDGKTKTQNLRPAQWQCCQKQESTLCLCLLKSAPVTASACSGDVPCADPRLLRCHLGPVHQSLGLGSCVNRLVIVT